MTDREMILLLKSQVEALEQRLNDMKLLMRRPGSEEYEKTRRCRSRPRKAVKYLRVKKSRKTRVLL